MSTIYLTKHEAANLIHVSMRHIDRNIKKGTLKAYKPGKEVIIKHSDLITFAESHPKTILNPLKTTKCQNIKKS